MTENIRSYLESLYGAEDGSNTYIALMTLLEKTHIPPQPAWFSERDALLIAYGDSLQQTGEAPLQTLNRFLLDRLQGIISGVHILPFFPYTSDDGFSISDYYTVNPVLGEWEHIRSISQHFRLMADLVLNHMSAQSDWFRAFLDNTPDFTTLFMTASPKDDLSAVTRPRTSPLLTPFQKNNGETVYVWTTFSADQVDFDYRHPQTLLRMIEILLFYIQQGISIIRLDAVAFLWKRIGTSCIHLEETHRVVQLCRSILELVAPHVVLITETNVPHAENISYFGDGFNEAHMVYNFTLPPLLLYTMMSGNTVHIREWINSLSTPTTQTAFFNFTASHDGIGVRPLEGILGATTLQSLVRHIETQGGRVSYKRNSDGSQSPYELNSTYLDAVVDRTMPVQLQVKQFIVSQAIMLALQGVPAIYIHSLLGSRNDQRGVETFGYNRAINREKLQLLSVLADLDNPQSFRSQVFKSYSQLLRVRTRHSAFHPTSSQKTLDIKNDGVLALLRESTHEKILTLHNVTPHYQTIVYPIALHHNLLPQSSPDTEILMPFEVKWLLV